MIKDRMSRLSEEKERELSFSETLKRSRREADGTAPTSPKGEGERKASALHHFERKREAGEGTAPGGHSVRVGAEVGVSIPVIGDKNRGVDKLLTRQNWERIEVGKAGA